MKKFVSIVLAVLMVAALATSAFAESVQTESAITITFDVTAADESYEVVIPASISASTARPAELASFGFANVNVVSSRVLSMSVSSANGWKLCNGLGDELSYSLMNASDAAISDTVVSIQGEGLEANASASEDYYALITDGIGQVAHLGSFSDQLTFTFAVDDISDAAA